MSDILEGSARQRSRAIDASIIDVNYHLGALVRKRRLALGLSQQQFSDLIGVTYQQAYKYERGINQIAAGRLVVIAAALAVPVTWFFDGLGTSFSS